LSLWICGRRATPRRRAFRQPAAHNSTGSTTTTTTTTIKLPISELHPLKFQKRQKNHHELRRDSNPVVSFFEECVEFDPMGCVGTIDLYYAFCAYVRDDMRVLPSAKSFGRWIKAMGDPRVAQDNLQLRSRDRRHYDCVKLNELGLDYWSA